VEREKCGIPVHPVPVNNLNNNNTTPRASADKEKATIGACLPPETEPQTLSRVRKRNSFLGIRSEDLISPSERSLLYLLVGDQKMFIGESRDVPVLI